MLKAMGTPPTMLCVHAHPDDEALFTGGVQAHYGDRGVRQVLITFTNGNLGIDPEGRFFTDEGHDAPSVVALRAEELAASCAILGIDRAVQLGYHDSGMAGWETNKAPDAFVNQDIAEVADRIAAVIADEKPHVVVTYAADGYYGHPDHIATHHATMEAVRRSEGVQKVYFIALAKTALAGFIELARGAGMALPEWLDRELVVGIDDELVGTIIDCSDAADRKQRALAAHRSQHDNQDLVAMPSDLFTAVFGTESYVRGLTTTNAPFLETDFFTGVEL